MLGGICERTASTKVQKHKQSGQSFVPPGSEPEFSNALPVQILRDLLHFPSSAHFPLQCVQQLCAQVRPPLCVAGHLHRQAQLLLLQPFHLAPHMFDLHADSDGHHELVKRALVREGKQS
jgi:hypothetical protein